MGRDGVPQDHATLGAWFIEDAVDDRSGGLLPRPRAAARPLVWMAPAQQVKLAGEGNARPAHPLIAGRFANSDDVGRTPFLKATLQVGEPDRRCIRHIVRSSVPELVAGG